MSVRTELAAGLRVALAEHDLVVEQTMRELQSIERMTLQVGAVTYSPDPQAPMVGREIEVVVWLIAPYLDPDEAEDELEDLLELVLAELDDNAWVVWQQAQRSTYPSGYPAYKITATSPSTRPES